MFIERFTGARSIRRIILYHVILYNSVTILIIYLNIKRVMYGVRVVIGVPFLADIEFQEIQIIYTRIIDVVYAPVKKGFINYAMMSVNK